MAELEQMVVPDLLRACKVTPASLAALYQRFFRSPHFYPWLNSRKELAQLLLDRQVTSLILSADIHALISNLPVRHAIQMFHSVHQHMARLHSHTQAQESYAVGDLEFLRVLQEHRSTILAALPDSIRHSVAASRPPPRPLSAKPPATVSAPSVAADVGMGGAVARAGTAATTTTTTAAAAAAPPAPALAVSSSDGTCDLSRVLLLVDRMIVGQTGVEGVYDGVVKVVKVVKVVMSATMRRVRVSV